MSAWDAQGMWTDLNAGSSTSYTQRPVWMEKKVRWIGRSEGAGNDAQGQAGCTSGTACDKAQSNWLAQCAEHSSMQGATDLLRSHYAAQRSTHPDNEQKEKEKQTARQHTLYAARRTPHTRGRTTLLTLRLEVWQLRHDCVVLFRRRLRWSMSMEKSRSRRSPFMTCVCADSANIAGTVGAGGGGAATTTTRRGGGVLARGTAARRVYWEGEAAY